MASGQNAAHAQVDPLLTGVSIIAQLEAAQHDLSARAATLPDSALAATGKELSTITESLRKSLGNDAAKPISKIGDEASAEALRGYAAAQQTEAYLNAAKGCLSGDANAMATALAATVAGIAHAPKSGKSMQPAIYAQETADHRAVFGVRSDSKDVAFALTGVNLSDAECDSPLLTVTDDKGVALSAQPMLTAALPNRLELKLPNNVSAGSYVLHLVPKKKGRLFGCSAQPEAITAVQITPPVHFSISYSITAACRASRDKKGGSAEIVQAAVTGALPDITAYGSTVSQQVSIAACEDPVSYSISAKASYADGSTSAIGPIVQSAAADITAGLPGGISFNWDPSVRTIFVRLSQSTCSGIY